MSVISYHLDGARCDVDSLDVLRVLYKNSGAVSCVGSGISLTGYLTLPEIGLL